MDAASDWMLSQGKYSLDFDGSNDYVEAGAVGLPTGAADRTITAWVWLNNQVVSGASAIVDLTRSSGQGFILQVGGNGGSENFAFTDGVNSGNNLVWPNGGAMEPAGVWTFRAITLQGNAYSIVSRQFNGPFRVRTSGTFAVAINTNTNGVYFGARKGFTSNSNKLTDIRIYNRVLSVNELQTLSLRPGIAYEIASRRRSSVAVAGGGFKAAWIPRRSLVIGGGTN
jgi:hypothetical protein